MANSFVRYTGDGTTTAYSIPFSYRVATDLTVTLAGVTSTAFTINAAGTTLTFSSAPAGSAAIEIRRKTSQTSRLTDYESGSILTETDLDTDSTQAFFMSQEAIDDANDVIKISNTNFQWDGLNKRLTNIADPTGAQDLATKSYVDTGATSASSSATAAASSATAAASSATSATSSATSATSSATSATASASTATTKAGEASTSATAAASSATSAASSATTATTKATEGVSSATAAATSATAASTSATAAASSATTASTAATNAGTSETNAATSATAAAASATAAEGYTDAFDDKYLGSKSSDPATDNDGDALTDGALYFNTTANTMKVYDLGTTEWLNMALSSSDQTNVNTVATNITNVNSVGSNISNVNSVAGNSTNINAVAADSSDIGTVSTNIASVNTVASNVTNVNSFANLYTISAGAPSSPSSGDLWYDSTNNVLKSYNGSSWAAVTSATSGITNVVDDTSPQLGGDLDANGNDIDMGTNVITDTKVGQWDTTYGYGNHASAGYVVASNNLSDVTATTARTNLGLGALSTLGTVGTAQIDNDAVTVDKLNLIATSSVPSLEAKGDGVSQDGYIQLNCFANSHGIKLKSPPHSAGATYTLTFPNTDGNADEFLQTDGSGVLTWAEAGGASADGTIYENATTISSDYTLTTGKNGMSVGAITLATGVTVTIPTGQRWVIL